MAMLSTELANESSQLHIRNAAALALKNALSARVRKRVVSPPSSVFTSYPGCYKTNRGREQMAGVRRCCQEQDQTGNPCYSCLSHG